MANKLTEKQKQLIKWLAKGYKLRSRRVKDDYYWRYFLIKKIISKSSGEEIEQVFQNINGIIVKSLKDKHILDEDGELTELGKKISEQISK